ncbi:MAG: helix-turn-helix transcriptional regulator [Planctomycetota bacterium]|nr:helix-turn-helix transcriptional regulator [Planctomycetota bacterium]
MVTFGGLRMGKSRPMSRILFRESLSPGGTGLVGAGYIFDKGPPHEVRERTLKVYALVYVLDGGGWYADTRGERPLRAGDCLVLFPGLTHSYYRKDSPRWDECFLMFSGGVFEQLERDRLIARDRPVLSPGLKPPLVAAFDGVIQEFVRERLLDGAILAARVHLLLAELAAAHRAAALGGEEAFASRARALVEENLAAPCDFRAVARRMNLSYERFRKRFVQELGMPPAKYRVRRRIDRAKTLLAEGRLPLKAVAERLGYCDLYFFCRQFKQETGVTPGAFRRSV